MIWKKRMNSCYSSKSSWAKQVARQDIELILPPKQQRRPLPFLLYKSFFYMPDTRDSSCSPPTHNHRHTSTGFFLNSLLLYRYYLHTVLTFLYPIFYSLICCLKIILVKTKCRIKIMRIKNEYKKTNWSLQRLELVALALAGLAGGHALPLALHKVLLLFRQALLATLDRLGLVAAALAVVGWRVI